MRTTLTTRAMRCLRHGGGAAAFWSLNLFASQASLDAYRADARVLAADKAKSTLVTTAVLQTLGWTNTVATTNPPGTVTLKNGTVGYGAHNLLQYSSVTIADWTAQASVTLTQNTVLDPFGLLTGATIVWPGAATNSGILYSHNVAGLGAGLAAGNSVTRSIYVRADVAGGTVRIVDPAITVGNTVLSLTSAWQRVSLSEALSVSGAGVWLQKQADSPATIYVACAQVNRGPVALDYVPTTSAAVYAPRLSFDRGATQNMLLNSATLGTQTVTVVSGKVYTISALGTGTVTLSGGGSGVLTCNAVLRNQVTFTASTTSVTCTVSGSVLQANFNPGYATNYLATAGAILYTAGTPRSQNLINDANGVPATAGTNVTLLVSNATDANGGATAKRYDWAGAANGQGVYTIPSESGVTIGCAYVLGWWVRAVSGSGTVSICDASDTEATTTGVAISTTWTYVRHRKTATRTTLSPWIKKEAGSPAQIEVYLPHVYEGQADLPLANVPLTTGTPYSEYPQLEIVREVARTNFAQQSAAIDNAYWTKTSATISADATTAPDGTTTADKMVEAAATATHTLDKSITTATSGLPYTASVYLKPAGRTNVTFRFGYPGLGDQGANFDLSTGTVGTLWNSPTAASIVPVGGGWYRCIITATSASSTGAGLYLAINNAASASKDGISYLGDGASGVYVWGFQFEQGAFPTSYIPTTTASVTRDADLIRPPTTYINDTAQTTCIEFVASKADAGALQMLLARNSGYPAYLGSSATAAISDNTNSSSGGTAATGVSVRLVTRYSAGGIAASLNGAEAVTASYDGTMGSGTVGLGDDGAGNSGFTGGIRRIALRFAATNDSDFQLAAAGGR